MSEMWIEFDERRSTSLQGMRTEVAQTHDPVCSRAATGLPDHGRGGVVANVDFDGSRVGSKFFMSFEMHIGRISAPKCMTTFFAAFPI